jgi:hypothetical protein
MEPHATGRWNRLAYYRHIFCYRPLERVGAVCSMVGPLCCQTYMLAFPCLLGSLASTQSPLGTSTCFPVLSSLASRTCPPNILPFPRQLRQLHSQVRIQAYIIEVILTVHWGSASSTGYEPLDIHTRHDGN